ncbi:hypothetical protein ACT6QG_08830 [Xanthobacter sp. TB0136]|uniref:hypothetical protein n=1 Tax=Xanthobacter sp. TB0136 TaxID=3459177 RepID=UPI00403A609D
MAASTAKLPFILSLRWSAQWAVAVVIRHQLAVGLYMVAGIFLGILLFSAPDLAFIGWIALGLASIALALVTHNEVLRGPSTFGSPALGPSGGRIFTYMLDCLVLVALIIAIILFPTIVMVMLAGIESAGGSELMWYGMIFITAIVGLVLTSRLALRLPSRAIGETIRWGDAWRLGEGHTLVLVISPLLLTLPFTIISLIAEMMVSPAFGDTVNWGLMPLQVIVTCTFLSVAYGRLRAFAHEELFRLSR